jgi:hypothetical protein
MFTGMDPAFIGEEDGLSYGLILPEAMCNIDN